MADRTVSTAAALQRLRTDLDAGQALYRGVAGIAAFARNARQQGVEGLELDEQGLRALLDMVISHLDREVRLFDEMTG